MGAEAFWGRRSLEHSHQETRRNIVEKKSVALHMENGMDARVIAEIVQLASKYESALHIEAANVSVNAKSIMGMMTLNLISGLDVTITADGEDEEVAVEQLAAYITGK